MRLGSQLLARALGGVGVLMLVAQCSNSSALSPDSSQTEASPVETAAIDTTLDTSVVDVAAAPPATTTTIAEPTTTTVAPTTTTIPEPTTTTVPAPVIDPNCPTTPHAAVIDRDNQRAYLCDNGVALPEFVITSALDQPDPGTYPVFSKSMKTSSRFGGHYSTMTHFVAFTRGEKTGARVAFHTVPVLRNGEYVQPLASVGTQMMFGASSGCIRVLPEQGQVIWDWLQKGDEVRVIT
jgi:L,D-transpeptidase catalytic domain